MIFKWQAIFLILIFQSYGKNKQSKVWQHKPFILALTLPCHQGNQYSFNFTIFYEPYTTAPRESIFYCTQNMQTTRELQAVQILQMQMVLKWPFIKLYNSQIGNWRHWKLHEKWHLIYEALFIELFIPPTG